MILEMKTSSYSDYRISTRVFILDSASLPRGCYLWCFPVFNSVLGGSRGRMRGSRVPLRSFPLEADPLSPRAASAPRPAVPPASLRALAAASGSWVPTATPADALGGRALEEPGAAAEPGRGQALWTPPDGAIPLRAPGHPLPAAVGLGSPGTPRLPSPPPHPVGSSEAGPKKKKTQSRDQRAQTAANSGSAPGGGSRGGEESPRARARKGVAAGARAVLAPRGLGLRASADRASRGGALPPRPISGRHCRLGGGIEVRVSRRRLR